MRFAIAAVVFFLSFAAVADTTFTVQNATGQVNEQVEVVLSASGLSGITKLDVRLVFDPAVLELVKVEQGDRTASSAFLPRPEAGAVSLEFRPPRGVILEGGGNLAVLTFAIRPTAPVGVSRIDIVSADIQTTDPDSARVIRLAGMVTVQPCAGPPAVPNTPTVANVSSSSVRLTWPAVDGAQGYEVYRGGVFVARVDSNTFEDTQPGRESDNCYTVAAIGRCATSVPSQQVCARTPCGQLSGSPTLNVYRSSDNSFLLIWTPVPGATSYRVYKTGADVTIVYEGQDLSVTVFVPPDSSPVSSPSHCFRVEARNGCGEASPLGATRCASLGLPSGGGIGGGGGGSVPVTVVKVTPTLGGRLPVLTSNDSGLTIPGVGNVRGGAGLFVSDLTLANSSTAPRSVSIYFISGTTGNSRAVATTLAPSSAVRIGDVVRNLFGTQNELGGIHIRGAGNDVSVVSNIFVSDDPAGTFGTALPAFRTDRAIRPLESLTITDVRKDDAYRTNVYLQEVVGIATDVNVAALSADGEVMKVETVSLAPFETRLRGDFVPSGGASIRVTNLSGGSMTAIATPVDARSGDTWAIADWSRFYAVPPAATLIVPVVGSVRGAGGLYFRSDVSVANPAGTAGTFVARYRSRSGEVFERTIVLPPSSTHTFSDVVEALGAAAPSIGWVEIVPAPGTRLTAASRTYSTSGDDPATYGTGVPSVPQTFALRRGGKRILGGLDDSSLESIVQQRPATFRLNAGIVETTGAPVMVRVGLSLTLGSSRTVIRGNAFKDYEVGAHGFLLLNGIVADILGPQRAELGDFNNVTLTFEIVAGEGAVIPYVTSTDNGSGDTVLRVE